MQKATPQKHRQTSLQGQQRIRSVPYLSCVHPRAADGALFVPCRGTGCGMWEEEKRRREEGEGCSLTPLSLSNGRLVK